MHDWQSDDSQLDLARSFAASRRSKDVFVQSHIVQRVRLQEAAVRFSELRTFGAYSLRTPGGTRALLPACRDVSARWPDQLRPGSRCLGASRGLRRSNSVCHEAPMCTNSAMLLFLLTLPFLLSGAGRKTFCSSSLISADRTAPGSKSSPSHLRVLRCLHRRVRTMREASRIPPWPTAVFGRACTCSVDQVGPGMPASSTDFSTKTTCSQLSPKSYW